MSVLPRPRSCKGRLLEINQFVHWVHLGYSISGLFIGLLVGMTGVGGGSLMTAVHGINGTVERAMVRHSACGSIDAGDRNRPLFFGFDRYRAAGVTAYRVDTACVIVGSYISGRIPDKVLRPVLASTLAVVGARLSF